MVEVELRTPHYDPSTRSVEWHMVATIRVDVRDEIGVLDFHVPVVSLRSGEQVRFEDDPEEWARNLVTAYRAPDLVAVVVSDDDAVRTDELRRPGVVREHVELDSERPATARR